MDQHSIPFEQRMTPADILRPVDDTCPVSSDSESEGIFIILAFFSFCQFVIFLDPTWFNPFIYSLVMLVESSPTWL